MNTIKQELNGTKAYEMTSTDEKSVVNSHSNELRYKICCKCQGTPRQTSYDLLVT